MKKLLLTGVATIALAVGVFAQGSVQIDNMSSTHGFAINSVGNFYAGTMGLEVWMLNGGTVPAGLAALNGSTDPGAGVTAYAMLTPDGFTLEKTYAAITSVGGGVAQGEWRMADVSPKGGNVTLALAAWNTADATWNAMASSPAPTTRAGVLAFMQPTTDYTAPGPPPVAAPLNLDSAGTDLVMTTVPEPGVFALAGLGAAALLIFRRRK